MKKTLITLLLLLLLLPQSVQAAEGDESALASVESAAGVGDISTPDTYEKMTDSGKKDLLSASLTVIQDTLTGIFGNVSGTLFLLLATVLLAALLHTARGLANSRVLESAVELLIVLALAGILYTSLKTLFEMTRQAFLNLSVFLTSFLPVTASLYTMTGSTATAAAGTSLMLLFNNAVVALADRFLFPLLQVCFALSLVSAVPNGISLQSIITLVKNTVTTLLAFAFTMFSAVLYFQTAITASADNLAYRSIRFASGVFIPVIGSVIGDASRTVNASIATVKSTVGYIGVAALAILLLPPIITAILYKFVVLLAAMAARILGCHDVGAFHEGDQAGGRVSGVADRRGGEHDRSARNVDVGDQSVEPEFGTFRGLRGFLGIFRVLADFGNLTNICFHGLFHGVTSLLGISLFAQVLHISSIAHSVPKPSAPAISPPFATDQSKPDQTTDDATRPHR